MDRTSWCAEWNTADVRGAVIGGLLALARDATAAGRRRVTSPVGESGDGKCVYADRLETGVDILEELSELEDGGYYGTTHIVWGCLLLRRFSTLDGNRIDALMDQAIESMKRRQRTDIVGDLFAERVAFLQWAGRHDDVDRASIWRIVRAQRNDGSWGRVPSIWPQPPSQHTSCLALAALIDFRAHEVSMRRLEGRGSLVRSV